jgi:protein ImuB
MSRIVSVWLPRWPIIRFLAVAALNPASKPVDPDRPLVLTVAGTGGLRITAMNQAAENAGLAIGDSLADARAKAGTLQVHAEDSGADDAALRRLALWATRYTPAASPWNEANGADGFFLDIEGAAHLFGGEESLLADLAGRLNRFELPARLAVADTPGMAWALSRFHAEPHFILPSGCEAAALAKMPIAALRLSLETRTVLRRLGFKSVGALMDTPRAPLAARFTAELLNRLDQVLGRLEEPLVPIVAPPVYHSMHYALEPIVTQQAIVARACRLMQNLTHVLVRDGVGARALKLSLYRVDGAVKTLGIGLTSPTRNAPHVARLIDLKLDALAAMQHTGFGFEAIGLAVTRADPMSGRQTELHPSRVAEDDVEIECCAALIDSLQQRLGSHRVRQFKTVASHNPERAEMLPPIEGMAAPAWPQSEQARPLFLLPRAEPTEVMALIPDGPPRRFSWRGVTYDIAGTQGPERIAAEWWLNHRQHCDVAPTRDYYLVEDGEGRRFWLYREGLYGRETAAARWFVHGLFA